MKIWLWLVTQIGLDSDQWWRGCHLHTHLNHCIKDLPMLLIFFNTCWWTQVHKETSWVPKQSRNQRHSAKFLDSDFFLFVSTFKATSPKLFNWFKRFSYISCPGRRHKIKNKIKSMADTFLDLAADSPVPVLSRTQYAPTSDWIDRIALKLWYSIQLAI